MSLANANYLWDPLWVPPYCNYVGLDAYADVEPGGDDGLVRFRDMAAAVYSALSVSTQGIAGSDTAVSPSIEKLEHICTRPQITAEAASNRLLAVVGTGWHQMRLEIVEEVRLWKWRWILWVGYTLNAGTTTLLTDRYIPSYAVGPHELVPGPQAVATWPMLWEGSSPLNGTPCQAELAQDLLQRAYCLAAAEVRFSPWRIGHRADSYCTDW